MKLNIINGRGNSRAIESAENIADNTHRGIRQAYYRSGKDLTGIFNRQVLRGVKTGRIYIRRDRLGRGRKHQASAPGESPANRTGFYRKSIGFNASSRELTFGNSAEYAGYLELGTSRMKARPGLGNAVKEGERDIIRNFTSGILDQI